MRGFNAELIKSDKMKSFLIVVLSFVSSFCYSQSNVEPAKWSFDINQVGPVEYVLVFRADIEEPWVVYAQDVPEYGPIPTSITYTSDNIEILGDAIETGDAKEGLDLMFDMKLKKFSHKEPYVLKQKIRLKDRSVPITGYVTYMSCNNEVCLPPKDVDFSFTIRVINPLESMQGNSVTPKKKQ